MNAERPLLDEPAPGKALFANRAKVYPKIVAGRFRRLKWAAMALLLGLYYLAPWLRWDRGPGSPDQAILADIPGARLYFFFIEIWPQEVYYLTGLLILGAVGLFLATALFGRIWCGFACPQTVWSDLYLQVERWIEGERAERIRLDHAPWSIGKLARKLAKHTAWLLIAAATGGAWIFYFNDAPTLMRDLGRFQASPTVLFFIALFTATTYLLAGWVREQVCIYMCPWPRFQAAMLDEHSTIVTYEAWRGEPRGPKRKTESWDQRGDCIDCRQCVQVCPTGIDIRDGQQLACIGCGLCIDACNDIMARIERPGDLIAFDTEANQLAHMVGQRSGLPLFRPRVLVYVAVLTAVAGIMLFSLMNRSDTELTVQRDRAPLFVALGDGDVRNSYTVKILNKTREDRDYRLSVDGLPQARITVVGHEGKSGDLVALPVKADAVGSFRIHIRVPRDVLAGSSTPIDLLVTPFEALERHAASTLFLGPVP